MSPNHKKIVAYSFTLLLSIIVGVAAAFVAALLGAVTLVVASSGAAGFVAIMGFGTTVIGPFEFASDQTPSSG